jgi:MFS family permease
MVHGVSSALVAPIAFAYIGDITPQSEEGKYMSIINLATFVGMGIGPYLGGKLADTYGIRSAFLAMFSLGTLSSLLVLLLLPDLRGKRADHIKPTPFRKIIANDMVKGLMTIYSGSAVRRAILMAFLPIFASYVGLSKTHMGVMISVFVVTAAVVQYPAGLLADKFRKSTIIMIGELGAIFCFALFPLVKSFGQLLAVGITAGLAGGIAMPSILAMNAEIGLEYGMASMMGLSDASMGFGMLFGALTGGLVMNAVGVRAVFYYGICASLAGVSAFTFFTRRWRRLQSIPGAEQLRQETV